MNKVVIYNESHLTMREAIRTASLTFPKTGEQIPSTMVFVTKDDGSGVSLFSQLVDSELTIFVRGGQAARGLMDEKC